MTWQELIWSVSRGPIVLFSTVTTGVHHTDTLLAVSYCKIQEDGSEELLTLFQSVSAERALQGVDYHHITMHTLSEQGLEKPEFERRVSALFDGATAFSYNPSFQLMALNEMAACDVANVYDLALTTNTAVNHGMLSAEELDKVVTPGQLMTRCAIAAGAPPPFKRVMKMCDIVVDDRSDILPVVTNVQILKAFWKRLGETELLTY